MRIRLIMILAAMVVLMTGCLERENPVPEIKTSDGKAIHASFVSMDRSSTELNKFAENAAVVHPGSKIAVKLGDAVAVTMSIFSKSTEESWTWKGSDKETITNSLKVPNEVGTYVIELEAKRKSEEMKSYYFAVKVR